MAEIEISVAHHQCLDTCVANQATLEQELKAWSQNYNAAHCGTDWQFAALDSSHQAQAALPFNSNDMSH